MALQPFTKNYSDESTEAGFQFTFFCDLCGDGYKTTFIESKTYKKAGLFKFAGQAIGTGANLFGMHNVGNAVERGSNIMHQRFEGMTPEWHKEHEAAFKTAQNEAMGHFHRCAKCRQYVCDADWNEEDNLCVECAPRENVEVTAARAARMKDEIQEKARETNVFTGKIERRQTVCPQCGKPTGEGKFCNNCGASLGLDKCPKCGAKAVAGMKFCGECGNKIG